MKISNRSYPALEYLKTDMPLIKTLDVDKAALLTPTLMTTFMDKWKVRRHEWRKNIIVVSQPFAEAAMLHAEKLTSAGLLGREEVSGTLCYRGQTIFYKSRKTADNDLYEVEIIYFIRGTIGGFNVDETEFISAVLDEDMQELGWSFTSLYRLVQVFLMFKKYAQVELKYLKAGQRIKGIDCKYINETDENITHLDSKWFTTLIKSDAFKVRGHFRLQPKKKVGEWTKELIWINEFQKDGYTAPARKLKEA